MKLQNCHLFATFCMCQCQDGSKVLKCYEGRFQGIERFFRKPKHIKEHLVDESVCEIIP